MTQRYDSIQALRGIAALAVVAAHAAVIGDRYGSTYLTLDNLNFGRFGVDLFFVISGFIISTVSGFFSTPIPVRAFFRKRLIRIVPIYWFYTTVVLITYFAFPGTLRSYVFEPLHAIGSYFFVPIPRPNGDRSPILIVGWTLVFEMAFYLVLGLSLFYSRNVRFLVLIGTYLFFYVSAVFIEGWLAFWLAHELYAEFIFGVIIGYVVHKGAHITQAKSWALMVAGFATIAFLPLGFCRVFTWGAACTMIVLGAVMLKGRTPALMLLLGNASYSIYLSHLFVLNIIFVVVGKTIQADVLVACATVIAAILGVVAYLFIEKPMLTVLNSRNTSDDPSFARQI